MKRNLLLAVFFLFAGVLGAQNVSTAGLNSSASWPCSIRVYAQTQTPVICKGGIANLKALVTDGSPQVKYNWSNGYTMPYWAAVGIESSTTYTVTVTDTGNCTASSSINIVVKDPPVVNLGSGKITTCKKVPARITATATGGTPGYKYVWSPVAGIDNPLAGSAWVSAVQNTLYGVTVTDNQGCTASGALNLVVTDVPVVSVAPGAADVCIGSQVKLSTVVMPAGSALTYKWSSGQTTPVIDVSPVVKTTYTVTVTDTLNCSASASSLVTVYTLPTVSVAPLKVNVCADSTVTLRALPKGGVGPFTYTWSNDLGKAEVASIKPVKSTAYTVTVTDSKNCSASTTSNVTVNAVIQAAISTITDSVCIGAKTLLVAKGTGGNSSYTYKWSGSALTSASIFVQPVATTTYKVTVTDMSALRCSATAMATLSVRDTARKPLLITQSPADGLSADNTVTLSLKDGNLGNNNARAHWVWYAGAISKGQPIDSFKTVITVSPKVTTNYYVKAEGGCNNTAPVMRVVTVAKPVPAVVDKTVVSNKPVVTKVVEKIPVAEKPVVKPKEVPVTAAVVKAPPKKSDIVPVPPIPGDTAHLATQLVNDVAGDFVTPEIVKEQAAESLYKFLHQYLLAATLKPLNPTAPATKESAQVYKSLFMDDAVTIEELRPTIDGKPTSQFNTKPINKYINDMLVTFPKGLIVSMPKASIDFTDILKKETATVYIEKVVGGVVLKPGGSGTNLYKSHIFQVLHVRFLNDFKEVKITKVTLIKGEMQCLDCDAEQPASGKEKFHKEH